MEIDIPAARLERIQELVRRNAVVSLKQVQRELGVSEMTVRRDFAALDEMGLVRRTRGGIIAVERVAPDTSYAQRSSLEARAKDAIGELAASCVDDGDAIFLGGGTTCLAMARALAGREGVTVITTSVQALPVLMADPKLTVISSGGTASNQNRDLTGPLAQRGLAEFRTQKAFISVSGVLADGVYDANLDRAMVNRVMSEHAAKTYVLADHTKLGTSALARVVTLADVTRLITDRAAERAELDRLREAGLAGVLTPRGGARDGETDAGAPDGETGRGRDGRSGGGREAETRSGRGGRGGGTEDGGRRAERDEPGGDASE